MKLKELCKSEEKSILTVMGQQLEKFSGDFLCYHKHLTTLKGSPKKVYGDFLCYNNHLTTLKGSPTLVGGSLICKHNQLESFETSIERIGGRFDCIYNKLTNLKDIHKQIKYIGDKADFAGNPIKSHVVGLLLIEGLVYVILDNKKVQAIINKHLRANRDVLACIEELEDAGYSEFAKI